MVNFSNKKHGFRNLMAALLLILIGVCTVKSTVAFLMDSTAPVENTFAPAEVDVEIEETFENNQKTNIKVKNIGTVKAYIRVRLIAYWCNTTNQIIAKESWLDESTLTPKNGWFAGGDGYYYYQSAVEPNGGVSGILFDDAIVMKTDTESGTKQVLEINAEAIQADPADAVTEAWTAVNAGQDGVLTKKLQGGM